VSTEFSLAQEKERDSNVAGYWPQAYRFHLAYVRNGKHVRTTHVPDITSIQTFPPRLILEETKTEEEWVRISRQHVGWVIKEDGRWRNPTLEELFGREYGYEYRLRSAAEFSQQLIANYNSLAAYYAATAVPVSDAGYAEIQDQFCSRSSMPMHELVAAGVSVDDVYKSIVEGLVAFDLENDDIDDTAHAVIYRDRVALRMFRRAAEQHNSAVRSSMLSSLVPGSKLIYDSVTYVAKVVGHRSNDPVGSRDDRRWRNVRQVGGRLRGDGAAHSKADGCGWQATRCTDLCRGTSWRVTVSSKDSATLGKTSP
jgi:hypothetical protein